MRLTNSQKEFMDLVLDRPQAGLSTAIIHCDRRSGLTEICREAERRTMKKDDQPKVVSVYAGAGWEAVVSTCHRAGVLKLGYAYADSLSRAIRLLSYEGKRPVVLLMKACQEMPITQMQRFFSALDHATEEGGYSVRAIMLLHKVYIWEYKQQRRIQSDKQIPAWLCDRARDSRGNVLDLKFSRDGLEELEGLPLFEREAAAG